MGIFKGLRARLRAVVRRSAGNRELDEEIRFHLELETEKNRRLGMTERDARRVALAHFGGVQRVREEHHDVRRVQWIEQLGADIRFALRSLRRAPAIAAAAIITLALGIGANAAIFSAVNAVVLQPLPVAHPERLVMLWEQNPEKNWYRQTVAPANYLDWRAQVPAFHDVAAYADFLSQVTLTGQGEPRLLNLARVTGNFFSVLGVQPFLGRALTDDETWSNGRTRAAVLAFGAWRDQFGGDRAVVGRTVQLDGKDVEIVGVMPQTFQFPYEHVDAWLAIGWKPASRADVGFRRAHWMRAVARLDPGVTLTQADAQLQGVVKRLSAQYPETNRLMGAGMTPLQEFLIGDTRLPLLVLLGAVALLLLIACANVGNLLLVQAAGRTRETALRLALGAGRARLVRQALTESLVLSAVGGACGLALGWAGTQVLQRLQPSNMLRVTHFGVSYAVVGYVVAITTVSGMLFGLAPVLWARRRSPAEAMKDGSRGAGQGHRVKRWGDMLVIGEVALALLLTTGAGLLVRSFWHLRNVDAGFDPRGVLAVDIGLSQRYDTSIKLSAFWNELSERARALPGVQSVAVVSDIPLTGTSYTSDFIAEGRSADGYGAEVGHRQVSRDYFATMRVPVLRGRAFTAADRRDGAPVAVIDQSLAKSYFAGEDPVGKRIVFDRVATADSRWRTIVGVVGDEHQSALDASPKIEIFEPTEQQPPAQAYLVVRTTRDPASLTGSIRRIVRDLDPSLAIVSSRPMTAVRDDALARARFLTTLLLAFAVVGVVLSIVGVYGLLAQLARNRTREMGIRLALGASQGGVRWLVVRHGLSVTVAGLAIGWATTLFATRALTKLLFHVAPNDPWTVAAVALLLTATGAAASWLPARRASQADPALALRAD